MTANTMELIRDRISGSGAIQDMAVGLCPAPQMYPPVKLADVEVTDENDNVIDEYDIAGQTPESGPPRGGQQAFVKPLLIPHKASFEEWIGDWARGVDLWAEMEGYTAGKAFRTQNI